ncbi:hypothetical protein ACRRTK_000207 [Alexandromys fortis]
MVSANQGRLPTVPSGLGSAASAAHTQPAAPYLKQQPPPLGSHRTPGLTALGPLRARRSPGGLRAAGGRGLERLAAHQAHGAAHPARRPAGPGRGRGLPASRSAPSPSDLLAPGVCDVGKEGDAPGPPRRSPPPPPPRLRQAVGVRGPCEGRRQGRRRQTVGRGPKARERGRGSSVVHCLGQAELEVRERERRRDQRFDQKEQRSFLGARKDYWDFLFTALRRQRGCMEQISFVCSQSKLKTSLGKGRAFIRLCLACGQLAESVQLCLLSPDLTREWYGPRSPLLCPELQEEILDSLYALNGIAFNLDLQRPDLDEDWPMFSDMAIFPPLCKRREGIPGASVVPIAFEKQKDPRYELQLAKEQAQHQEQLLQAQERELQTLQEQLSRCEAERARLQMMLEQKQQEAERKDAMFEKELEGQRDLVRAMKRRVLELIQLCGGLVCHACSADYKKREHCCPACAQREEIQIS